MMGTDSSWRRLVALWLPAIGLCVTMIGLFIWQSSESLGRAGQLRSQLEELRSEVERLGGLRLETEEQRVAVDKVEAELQHLRDNVFGDLGERLTRILRAVGSATRSAGLLPDRFAYSAEELENVRLTKFQVTFAINGRYDQIQKMLGALQGSPEFLIVERISFAGDEELATNDLRISIVISTYLSQVDQEMMARIAAGDLDG
ncbi:MAG: hypothetical protein GY906_17280 [bacterium]|nr:hypothetical protein [bacterium]